MWNLDKLNELVRNKNLNEIHNIVLNAIANTVPINENDANSVTQDPVFLNNEEIVQFFLNQRMISGKTLVTHEQTHSTLISFAASWGNLSIVKLLDVNLEKTLSDDENSFRKRKHALKRTRKDALNKAALSNHLHIVEYLLQKRTNLEGSVTQTGIRHLARAALDGNVPLIEFFLKHGASIPRCLCFLGNKFEKFERSARYANAVKLLLDYAFGENFEESYVVHSLHFLDGIYINEFNFIGTSIEGKPITREVLYNLDLKGSTKALFTVTQLENLQDNTRREKLQHRLQICFETLGRLESNAGIVNLVPLYIASLIGDSVAVKARLDAGIDPNEDMTNEHGKTHTPIILAARKGHGLIVKMLAEHPKIRKEKITQAIKEARAKNHTKIADDLSRIQMNSAVHLVQLEPPPQKALYNEKNLERQRVSSTSSIGEKTMSALIQYRQQLHNSTRTDKKIISVTSSRNHFTY